MDLLLPQPTEHGEGDALALGHEKGVASAQLSISEMLILGTSHHIVRKPRPHGEATWRGTEDPLTAKSTTRHVSGLVIQTASPTLRP